ncbi:MAG: pseudouridine synthase [Verrucomicrobiota bacterium]|nr:pseudouridine synthase [Verrucomicrobiota bacterium]
MENLERLSKIMALRGLCSRREADIFIEKGFVTVNGNVVSVLGSKVPIDSEIKLSDEAIILQDSSITNLLNKPIGFVSGQPEDNYKPAISLIKKNNRWNRCKMREPNKLKNIHKLAPAGRLDIDSTGLLVFTQDGRIARSLIGDDSSIEKEYLVRINGTINKNGLKMLNYGLSIDGKKLKKASVTWLNKNQLKFILKEGKKRQIRRMCEMVGLKVIGLKRVRIGKIMLEDLPIGKWRYLSNNEFF